MNLFDKKIKQKLSQAEMPVEDGIWEAIETRIVHQKDNSRFWFLLIIPLLFAPAALLLWNSTQEIQDPTLLAQYESSQSVTDTEVTSLTAAVPEISDKNTRTTATNDYPQLTRLEELTNNKILNRKILSRSSRLIDLGFEPNKPNNINTFANTFARSNTSKVSVINGEIISGQTKQQALSINPLPSNSLGLKVLNQEAKDASYLFDNDPGSDCHDFKVYHPGFYAYTQFTADAPFQSLNPKSAEFEDFVDRRETTESAALSYSSTIGLGYRFDNGLFAESGITIDRINMSFFLPGDDEVRYSTLIKIDTLPPNTPDNPTDETVIVSDTTRIQIDGKEAVNATNQFTQIDIPLVVGFEFPINERLRIGLKGGVLVNIRSSNSGVMLRLNPEDEIIGYGSNSINDSQYFKTNIGFSYTGGLNLEADLGKMFSVYGGLNVRYYPNSFSLNDNPVQQSYSKVGLMAGLKYRI